MKGHEKNKIYSPGCMALEITAWILMALSYAIAIYGMNTLPGEIATHFDGSGHADGYGSPATLLIVPIIITFVTGLMSLILHCLPYDCFNIPFKVREENSDSVYRIMVNMMVWLELLAAIFSVLATLFSYMQSGKLIVVFSIIYFAAIAIVIVAGMMAAKKVNDRE